MGCRERVAACFKALASGDAIGKQTETLSHREVRRWYPDGISRFHGNPGDVIPRYVGNRRYEWRIGETTDDTEQTIAIARSLVRCRGVSHTEVGKELLKCQKSIHPDLSMWEFHQLNNPGRVALEGDGCGAAMRVAPVGAIYSPNQWHELIRGAYESSIPTHGGALAICAAAAVVGAISGAIEGEHADEVLHLAVRGARDAETFTHSSNIAALILEMHADLATRDNLLADDLAEKYFPNTNEIKIPLAINLALCTESAEQTILLAANIGGDADSVASIGGAIAGALHPDTVNEAWFSVVKAVNGDDLLSLAEALAELRS